MSKKTTIIALFVALKFNDPFEGAKGIKDNENKLNSQSLNHFIESEKWLADLKGKTLNEKEIINRAKQTQKGAKKFGKYKRKVTYISCWHGSSIESEAMWRLYAKDEKKTILLKPHQPLDKVWLRDNNLSVTGQARQGLRLFFSSNPGLYVNS